MIAWIGWVSVIADFDQFVFPVYQWSKYLIKFMKVYY